MAMTERLRVNMIDCDGHGVCAELVPELVGLDEWGYPIISPNAVPDKLRKHAKRAVTLCPTLALVLEPTRGR
jgi:ferredoxin